MSRYVVDTNVPIVANGRPNPDDSGVPSNACRIAAIEFLVDTLESGKVLLDQAGEIQAEYRRYLNPRGQPGVGDRFYLEVLNSAPKKSSALSCLNAMMANSSIFPRRLST